MAPRALNNCRIGVRTLERLERTGVYSKSVFSLTFLMKINNNSVHSLFGVEIQIVATQQPLIGIG